LRYGGVYWTVDHEGKKLEGKKHIYAQAFLLLGLSEYYKTVKQQDVLDLAVAVYQLVEAHAYDTKRKGYYQAFNESWSLAEDQRLISGDLNEVKSLKTHLHLLEAYTNLFGVWKNAGLRIQIENLLEVFAHHFVDDKTHHLYLFFDKNWNTKSDLISFGLEIEAAWLLQQAAEAIRHKGWSLTMKSLALKIAEAVCEGLDGNGGLNESTQHNMPREKHWWSQAEAMIGFYNAYQLSCEERWFNKSRASWNFIKHFIKDSLNGEWKWGVDEYQVALEGYDKIGLWKCPYHNGRACMELIRRLDLAMK
jgi:mannobiose 2-epimerase